MANKNETVGPEDPFKRTIEDTPPEAFAVEESAEEHSEELAEKGKAAESEKREPAEEAAKQEAQRDETEIERIKRELGLPTGREGLLENREKLLSTEDKFEGIIKFLGIREMSASRAERLRHLDRIETEKLEGLYQLVLRSREEVEIREKLRILRRVFDLTIREAREVVDTISAWTEDHSLRLAILGSRIIDRLWPFDDEFKKSFWDAGLLHDLGKASTPKKVLDKDGKPTKEEWEIIRRHPVNGERLLSNIERFDRFISQGTHHHEKIGGGGYSYGTKGETIPFVGRALAVVDVYDALSDFRPYKQGFSQEKAVGIIERGTRPQPALDERGVPLLDPGTHEPLEHPAQFDPLSAAHLVAMYENRELDPRQYFDADREEKKFTEKFEKVSPYAREKNRAVLEKSKEQLLALLSPALEKIKVASSKDLVDFVNNLEMEKLQALKSGLESRLAELGKEKDKFQDIYVDALFLLVKCIDARYQAYYEGMPMEKLSGGEERTSNVVRYSLMLAQQMGLSLEEQKKIARAAMFCDIGVLGADEDKVRNPEVLGVTAYEELKKIPEIGYRVLRIFMQDKEVAPYFEGADIGAAEANLWADGKGGYGVRLNPDGKPSLIGKIVAIAHKYTALRARNPYRGEGLSHDRAMEIMRRGVGSEFDEEIWEYWEKLYARDVLRVFKERPEVTSQVKELFKGEIPQITFSDKSREKLSSFMERIQEAKDEKEKMELCFEAAEYTSKIGFFQGMERFFELAEPIALKLGDERIVSLMEKLYDYDLEKSREDNLEAIRRRLEKGEVIKAIGAVESLVIDFAEKGQSISPELAQQIRAEVIPAYKNFVQKKVDAYRKAALAFDKDALKNIKKQIERGVKEIGDDVFEANINREMEEIGQEATLADVRNYIQSIKEFTEKKNDPFNGEHYVIAAEKLAKALKPQKRALVVEELARASRALYRRGYTVAFDKLQAEAEAGNVQVVLALEEKIKEWMEEAGDKNVISGESFAEQERKAYLRGIEKMKKLLAKEDLGLYDVARIGRWTGNISLWQKEVLPPAEQMGEEELEELRRRALEKVRENLPKEIEEALGSDGQRTLKGIVIAASDYIVKPNEEVLLTAELYRQMGKVRDRLFELFVNDIREKVEQGKIAEVVSAVGHFRDFCGGEGRNELIPLKDEQIQKLQEIKLEAHRKALAVRIENIAALGAAEMISRLEKELARLRKDAEDFRNMGGEIDERIFNLRLSEAVYSSFVSKITQSIKEEDVKGFSFVFGRLQGLIEKGVIEEREDALEALKEISLPFIQKSFGKLAKAGDLDSFEALERVAAKLLEKPISNLPEKSISSFPKKPISSFPEEPREYLSRAKPRDLNVSPPSPSAGLGTGVGETNKVLSSRGTEGIPISSEAERLFAGLEQVKRECYQNRIKQLEIQLKIYGVKSYIGLMRQTEDKLRELKEIVPELVDDSIFEYSQREAERLVAVYDSKIQSYRLLGHLTQTGAKNALRGIKEDLIASLVKTHSGQLDAQALERLAI